MIVDWGPRKLHQERPFKALYPGDVFKIADYGDVFMVAQPRSNINAVSLQTGYFTYVEQDTVVHALMKAKLITEGD